MADRQRNFESWYGTEYPRIRAALTLVSGDPEAASEATAEAFVRAWERWDKVRRMESPGGWLYKVALNLVRGRARRLAVERRLAHKFVNTAPAPALLAPEVWEAVRALAPRQRTAIALRYLLDYSEAQVAAAMGIAEGTASATLASARKRLAALLASEEPDRDQARHG